MHLNLIPVVGVILLCCYGCNKNSNQLPPKEPPPQKLVISAKLNGLNTVDFIFEGNTAADSNSVVLYIKNNSTETINRLSYVVELCRAAEQTFDNCDLQLTDSIHNRILPGQTSDTLYKWSNKNIKLDSSLINVGIISADKISFNPLANAYENGYTVFEGDDSLYGNVRGYILADGTATFRYKTIKSANYNAIGLFTPDKNAFSGMLSTSKETLSQFMLDSIDVSGTKRLIVETKDSLQFRLKLHPHLADSTRSILTSLKKHF